MLYVVGRWGDGTTLLAEIIRRHGFYFGQTNLPGWTMPEGRNTFGVMEDLPALQIFRREVDADLNMRLVDLQDEAAREGLRPALKMPWVLVRRDLWPTLEREADRAVFITRPSKPASAYTMHTDLQPSAVVNYSRLRDRWDARMPIFETTFGNLIEQPEYIIHHLASFLDVPFEPSAVDAVDPNWMRNKP